MAELLRSKYYENPSSYQRGYTAVFNAGMENAVKSGYAHPIKISDECDSEHLNKIWQVYNSLIKIIHDDDATKMDMRMAIADAVKLLGDVQV